MALVLPLKFGVIYKALKLHVKNCSKKVGGGGGNCSVQKVTKRVLERRGGDFPHSKEQSRFILASLSCLRMCATAFWSILHGKL